MLRSDLHSLTISNLRGYVSPFTLTFDAGNRLCIVYGENGTGKTTLCDALELLADGTLGSLDDRGLGKAAKYWTPVAGRSGPAKVELSTGKGSCVVAVENGKVSWEGTPRPKVVVLRRPALMKIVTATAADRYSAIESLVDVAGVEGAEQALSKLVGEVEKGAANQQAQLAGAQGILRELAGVSIGAGRDPIGWARSESTRDVSVLIPQRDSLGNLIAARAAVARRWDQFALITEELNRAREIEARAQSQAGSLPPASQVGDKGLLALLETASNLLSAHAEPGTCPLCESNAAAAGLAIRVERRLAAMSELRSAQAQAADAARRVAVLDDQLSRASIGYVAERETFEQIRRLLRAPDASPDLPEKLPALGAWLEATGDANTSWTQRHRELTSVIDNAARLRAALREHDENVDLAVQSSKLLAALKRGHEIAKSTRHTFVNELLDEVSQEVGRLYELVHPGEGLDRIRLGLDPNRRASLNLATGFRTVDAAPPQAYLSDSHLDTLGLCVFIALAKRRSPEGTILVLDDVLASVDEPHVDRLIEVIGEEAQGFRHVLVTTHYRPWRERLKRGWLRQGPCQVVELAQWSATGPTLLRSTPEVELLRALLAQPQVDLQSAVGKAGVILESVLDFLTRKYECKVRRKKGDAWTLGDLFPALDKKLKAALRIDCRVAGSDEYESHPLGTMLHELSLEVDKRNLFGAHFNKLADHLRDGDAIDFARRVLAIADLLVDPDHGWPESDKSGSYWATKKETRRLHPLREPG